MGDKASELGSEPSSLSSTEASIQGSPSESQSSRSEAPSPAFMTASEARSAWKVACPKDLAEHVTAFHGSFERDKRSNTVDAFAALAEIGLAAAYGFRLEANPQDPTSLHPEPSDRDLILVPWWIIKALTIGWQRYASPNGDPADCGTVIPTGDETAASTQDKTKDRTVCKSMEECFGLAGAKPGKHGVLLQRAATKREQDLVLEIACLYVQDPSRGGATRSVAIVSDRNGIDQRTAWDAWGGPWRDIAIARAKEILRVE